MVLTCCLALLFLKAKEKCQVSLPVFLQQEIQPGNLCQKAEKVIGPCGKDTTIV